MYAEAVAPPAAQLLEVLVAVIPMATVDLMRLDMPRFWPSFDLTLTRWLVNSGSTKT